MSRRYIYLALFVIGTVVPYLSFGPWVMDHGLDISRRRVCGIALIPVLARIGDAAEHENLTHLRHPRHFRHSRHPD